MITGSLVHVFLYTTFESRVNVFALDSGAGKCQTPCGVLVRRLNRQNRALGERSDNRSQHRILRIAVNKHRAQTWLDKAFSKIQARKVDLWDSLHVTRFLSHALNSQRRRRQE